MNLGERSIARFAKKEKSRKEHQMLFCVIIAEKASYSMSSLQNLREKAHGFNRGMNPMNRRSQCCRNDYFFQSSQTYIRSLMNTSQSNSLKAGPEAGAGPAGKEGESYPCGKTELMQQRKMK